MFSPIKGGLLYSVLSMFRSSFAKKLAALELFARFKEGQQSLACLVLVTAGPSTLGRPGGRWILVLCAHRFLGEDPDVRRELVNQTPKSPNSDCPNHARIILRWIPMMPTRPSAHSGKRSAKATAVVAQTPKSHHFHKICLSQVRSSRPSLHKPNKYVNKNRTLHRSFPMFPTNRFQKRSTTSPAPISPPPRSCKFSCQLSTLTKKAASRAKRSKIFSSAGNFASVRLGHGMPGMPWGLQHVLDLMTPSSTKVNDHDIRQSEFETNLRSDCGMNWDEFRFVDQFDWTLGIELRISPSWTVFKSQE